ncbi:MAG: uroporphyrinogen-III C-methyltransferase [Alphaproteobacteria bacterium]|nr:uroporphyrinogen-III C-methyltransferase [Alphaproteobacteria bacterium]
MLDWLKLGRRKGHFARLDAAQLPEFAPGSVWLCGAGPGAPGLLSLLAYHALGAADVIVHDALVSRDILALARPEAEHIPAGKRAGQPSSRQKDITLKIIELAWAGKRVLRLKGGDPYLFGRGGEEALALERSGIHFRVVPGISAGLGGLAYAGIPATHRDTNHAVLFLTGHDVSGTMPGAVDWVAISRAAPVIVLFMGVSHLFAIAEKLIAAGRDREDRVAIVSNATLKNQSVIDCRLGEVGIRCAEADIPTPAVIVIGPVSQFRDRLDWYTPILRENGFG